MNLNEINALISKAVETKLKADYDAVYAAMKEAEVFFNVKPEFPDGTGRMETATIEAAPGFTAIVFFISKTHPNIQAPFAGITWKKAMEMVMKTPNVDGLVIQGGDSAWIGLNKNYMRTLLAAL
jgi:hypothetical protein